MPIGQKRPDVSARLTTHGATIGHKRTAEFLAWQHMKQRCYNPTNRYYHCYGGRGISMCRRWLDSFALFLQDVGHRPSLNHSIDRIDNNGNYEPGNVHWSTAKEQSRNTRRTKLITFNGETMCLVAWAERLGFRKNGIHNRLSRGWTVEEALTLPPSVRRPRL